LETDPFRIRGHVPEFDAIVSEIKARSASTRARLRMREIAYGDGASETVDVFYPDGISDRRPVHMFIHGGYWRMFSKRDYSYVADTITGTGAIAIIVDYALMPHVRMEVLVDQVRRAKQWVLENIASHGGDASRLRSAVIPPVRILRASCFIDRRLSRACRQPSCWGAFTT